MDRTHEKNFKVADYSISWLICIYCVWISAKKKSLIEILVNLKDPVTGYLTEKQIRDEVDTFLFAVSWIINN